MTIGFFTVFRTDPQHLLHATGLAGDARQAMPDVPIAQLTDQTTPAVTGVSHVVRGRHGPMLEQRLVHYAGCHHEWLLLDTDVSIRADVRQVFAADPVFDVAFADRGWPHLPQTVDVLQRMPVNTGVCFSRSSSFWLAVLATWRAQPEPRNWLSEQVAVADVIRSGHFRVKILPGLTYNYPPHAADDPCAGAALVHYKGPRKAWLTARCSQVLAACG